MSVAVRRCAVERVAPSAAASLQHPNIVAIHEVGVHQGQHYFEMDFVDGPNLAQFIRDKPLPANRAAGYVKAIAEAIQFAHQRRILHRDLKPSNVLIDSNDQPRVTDFGLAKRFGVLNFTHKFLARHWLRTSSGWSDDENIARRRATPQCGVSR